MSESVSFSLASSSAMFKAKEMSVSGLPPDEMQETTQKSFPSSWCTISALIVTFGLAAEQEEGREELFFTSSNVFSSKLKSQIASRGSGCFG